MSAQPNTSDLYITLGVGALAVLGAIAKGEQWQDAKTGRINLMQLIGGIATALILAAAVRAAGVHYGVEPWIQVAGSGVLCYAGPDLILKTIANMALKRFGVSNDAGDNGKH